MKSIIIEYVDVSPAGHAAGKMVTLGTETYEGIDEVEIPRWAQHPMFCTKKFVGHDRKQWRVVKVDVLTPTGKTPAEVRVELNAYASQYPEEFLSQTVSKGTRTLAQLVPPGTLVEVDYGFRRELVRSDGSLSSNFRYIDSRQSSEMHKRRLAVVVSVAGECVNVAPITTDSGQVDSPARFPLSATTLGKLPSYGSGVNSYVIPAMTAPVSPQRILPPVSRGATKMGRSTGYPIKISSAERTQLHHRWLESVGIRDYVQLQQGNALRHQAETALAQANKDLATAEGQLSYLRLIEEIARSWAKSMGTNLDTEVATLRDLHEACGG